MASWCVIDLETTTHILNKQKASPWHPDNWVVMAGWQTRASYEDGGKPQGMRMSKDRQTPLARRFDYLLQQSNWLVGANINFDLQHILKDPDALRAWQKFVARGGLVWDVLTVECVLEGYDSNSHMLSLNEVSARYGFDQKVDEVAKLWEAGVPTEDIDPVLLSNYLLGFELTDPYTGATTGWRDGDIGLTRDVFLKQYERAEKLGMMRLLKLEMGAMCASVEMQRNGLYVDKAKGLEIAKEQREVLAAKTKELQELLPKDLPFEVSFTNRYHLSPILFGGAIKYDRRQYDLKDGGHTWDPPTPEFLGQYVYAQKDEMHYVLEDGSTMECSWYEALVHTEYGGTAPEGKERVTFKSGKNAGEAKTKKVKVDDYTKPKSRIVQDEWKFPGYVKPRDEWKSSTPGLYSTSAEVMEDLLENPKVPFLAVLKDVREITKDLSTYYDGLDGEGGMLALVGDDGVIHHQLNHNVVVTGRLSSSKPNLQNVSNGSKSRVRELFVSRFPGGALLTEDYSNLEVYCQANLSKATKLIQALHEGYDMHCMRLAIVEGRPYEEMLDLCKVQEIPEWVEKRRIAKVFTFRRAYGAGTNSLMDATGMTREQVEAMVAAEEAEYPELVEYFDKMEERVKQQAKPTANFVMHPDNPAVKVQLLYSKVRNEDGSFLVYKSSPASRYDLKRGITSTFTPTQIKNYIVQHMGAQVIKMAMWICVREFYQRVLDDPEFQAILCNVVHDAIYVDAPDKDLPVAAALLHACMHVAADVLCQWLKMDWIITVPSSPTAGPSWAEEHHVEVDEEVFQATVSRIRPRSILVYPGQPLAL